MKNTIIRIALLLMLSQTGFAQTALDKTRLDDYFSALEQNSKFMGSVAVSKNGKIIYQKSIGFADIENNIKASEKTKYRIGSISKTFTAVLVLKAAEENKLDLNQSIDKWFPTIQNANKITVKHLLNHRSGIHNFTNDKNYLTWNTQAKTQKEMVEIIAKGGSDFEPGSKAEYSNSNYVLLTYILQKALSKSYAALVKKNIARAVGLDNTYVFGPINTKRNESKSYRFEESWKEEPETHHSIPLGAGAIISTPADLTKFADALFGGNLLTSESLKTMKTVQDGYGIGVFPIPFYTSVGLGHTGGIDGFRSIFCHFADENISYALISNGANFNINDISIAVLSAVYGKPYDIPVFTTYALTSEELDNYVGVYASSQIPLKITITKRGNTLIAQGTGQPAFPLEATAKDKFSLDQAGAKFEFYPDRKAMILYQGGARIEFTRE